MRVGADVVDVERLRHALERTPGLAERLFTTVELDYCGSKRDPVRSLAGTLAAKEAVMKSRRLGSLPAWARRIEVTRDTAGAPSALIEGSDTGAAISISHDGGIAFAVAVTPVDR